MASTGVSGELFSVASSKIELRVQKQKMVKMITVPTSDKTSLDFGLGAFGLSPGGFFVS